jgi:hypothetical protein
VSAVHSVHARSELCDRPAIGQERVVADGRADKKLVRDGDRAARRAPGSASITSVPRSLASAASPLLAGYLLSVSAFGWPLIAAGGAKIVYDVLLLLMFRKIRPPEEARPAAEGGGRR